MKKREYNFFYYVDGISTATSIHFDSTVSATKIRQRLVFALTKLRLWTIRDRIRCDRYKDGFPHDISLHIAGRVIRFDVNDGSFSCTDSIEINGEFKTYIDYGMNQTYLINVFMLPYLNGYFETDCYYDSDTMF